MVDQATTPTAPAQTGVTIDGVTKRFPDGLLVVDRLSLNIPPGQFVALLGPSGCGKSTLLRMIAELEKPSEGEIRQSSCGTGASPVSSLTQTRAGRPCHKISFVFQDAHLMPWRSVLRNVALPLELAGVDRVTRTAAAIEQLQHVGLAEFADRYPAQLSGGMRMRVSLARALVGRPQLLLLDEPFAALDEITRQQLDDLLRSLWRRVGMTVLFVTHSIQEAVYLADRAIVFSARPARVMLDQDVSASLPADRVATLRTTTVFAEQSRLLFDALQAGERA